MSVLAKNFRMVRGISEEIASPLSPEDCVVQTMENASPVRWHLAHTTWFFETFVLKDAPDYNRFDDNFEYLFNSYYNSVGSQFPRSKRGLLSRPSQEVVMEYRNSVDSHILEGLRQGRFDEAKIGLIQLGLQHEQQHQELMITDLKNLLFCNSLYPQYRPSVLAKSDSVSNHWYPFSGGVCEIGYSGDEFCFDNEQPRHRCFTEDFAISSNLVTCGDFLEFINDDGYGDPKHWLSLGWDAVQSNEWTAPMYWRKRENQWELFTLNGWLPVDPEWPVCHVSFFEADAFARWTGKRLPTEFEWEHACECNEQLGTISADAQFLDRLLTREETLHPTRVAQGMLGGVWEWTQSSYLPYPGFQPAPGAVGEYNGKFMCNQFVLRGGSVATPESHLRATYRNFFPPETRWQFNGIRLADRR